jgi:hypothetical protein
MAEGEVIVQSLKTFLAADPHSEQDSESEESSEEDISTLAPKKAKMPTKVCEYI